VNSESQRINDLIKNARAQGLDKVFHRRGTELFFARITPFIFLATFAALLSALCAQKLSTNCGTSSSPGHVPGYSGFRNKASLPVDSPYSKVHKDPGKTGVTAAAKELKSQIEIQLSKPPAERSRAFAEGVRFLIAFGVALAGLLSGALGQLDKLALVPATFAIIALGFGADSIKNLLTQPAKKADGKPA
jgi:hypothetical protein